MGEGGFTFNPPVKERKKGLTVIAMNAAAPKYEDFPACRSNDEGSFRSKEKLSLSWYNDPTFSVKNLHAGIQGILPAIIP